MSAAKKSPMKFKHAEHAAWRRLDQESIVLDLRSSLYYLLNETGAFIWERLGSGETPSQAAAGLCAEFNVKPEAAERDVEGLIRKLRDVKLLIPG